MLCSMICNCKCLWICFSKRILDCDKLVHLKVVFANIKLKTWAAVSFWFRSLSPSGCGCHLCTWLCSMTALKVMNVPLLLPSIPVLNLIEYQIQIASFFLSICSVFFFPDLYLYEASDTFLDFLFPTECPVCFGITTSWQVLLLNLINLNNCPFTSVGCNFLCYLMSKLLINNSIVWSLMVDEDGENFSGNIQ